MNLVCKFCGKECKNANSLRNHERLCRLNPNKQKSNLSNQGWAKGLTKSTDDRLNNHSKSLKEHYKNSIGTFKGKHHSIESKLKISKALLLVDHSNKDRFSHGRKGYYDNIFFMSTYELAYYLYMKDTGHKIERCRKRFKYIYKGKEHYYTPDFIVDENLIVETKGYEREIDYYKYKSVDNLLVLREENIKPIIDWVKESYKVKEVSSLYTNKIGL